MYVFNLALQAAGLTLEKIVADIPHDAGAVVAYLLLGGTIFLVWYGSRKSVIQRYRMTPTGVSFREDEETLDRAEVEEERVAVGVAPPATWDGTR
jgi:hypothetical protein